MSSVRCHQIFWESIHGCQKLALRKSSSSFSVFFCFYANPDFSKYLEFAAPRPGRKLPPDLWRPSGHCGASSLTRCGHSGKRADTLRSACPLPTHHTRLQFYLFYTIQYNIICVRVPQVFIMSKYTSSYCWVTSTHIDKHIQMPTNEHSCVLSTDISVPYNFHVDPVRLESDMPVN